MNFEIPEGLGDMLRDFTVSVLRERPGNLFDFAAEYFARARDSHKPKSVPMYIIVDDDDVGEPDKEMLKPKTNKSRFTRRQSVSAERYDPEADDDDEKVCYPKTDQQRERLTEAVSGILIFRSLDCEQMQEVIDAMFEKNVEPGESIIKQGDDGDNFYVIDTGIFDVSVKVDGGNKKVHVFEDKGSFGELALMYNMPRSATITSASKGTLWAMDRKSFRRIVLKSAFKKRKMYEDLLDTVPMLKHLENYERMNLADALIPRQYTDGSLIMKEGDDADGMYFVEEGTLRITMKKDGKEIEIARVGKGKYCGELALVEQKPRSASVYAIGKVKVAFCERESFERLLGPCLDIMKRNIEQYKKST